MDKAIGGAAIGSGINAGGAIPHISSRAKARQLWLKIHRWIGLALLVPMAVLGVTGSAQVWPEETEALLNRQREVTATANPAAITAANIATARTTLEGWGPLASIEMGEIGQPIIASSAVHAPPLHGIAGPQRQMAWIDPAGGEVLDVASSSGSFMWYMHFIHGVLMIPEIGRQVVGWMGVFLVVSGVTGLVVFWPGRARFLAALRWQKRDGKALNLHRQSGVILSIVLIVEAITGAWISFPAFFAAIVEPGVEQPQRPRRGGGPDEMPLVMEDAAWIGALASAQAAYPGRPTGITAPVAADGAWKVTLSAPGKTAEVTLPLAGGVPLVEEEEARTGPPPPSTRAGAVSMVMRQLHYATIGGFVWQVLVFLSGLALTFLSLSGVYVWAKRKLKKRRRAAA